MRNADRDRRIPHSAFRISASQRLQILHEIAALLIGEGELQHALVVIHDRVQIGEASVMVEAPFSYA
jgi:hypothetical protein